MRKNNTLQLEALVKPSDNRSAQADELERLARWMDSVFEIPFLKLRFGLDALLGLLPGGGDVGAALVSVYILSAANRRGVSRITILRMAVNIALDMIVGSIPIAGDLFDAYWKSNQRNVALLRRHLDATPNAAFKLRRADRWFLAVVIVVLGLLLAGSLALAYFAVTWLISALSDVAGR